MFNFTEELYMRPYLVTQKGVSGIKTYQLGNKLKMFHCFYVHPTHPPLLFQEELIMT